MKIRKWTRKSVVTLCAAGAAFITLAPYLSAAITSQGTRLMKTSVNLSGQAAVQAFNVVVKRISDNSVVVVNGFPNDIGYPVWTNPVLGADVWKASDMYIELTAQSTYPGWGVQFYTDNKNSFTGAGNPAGLVAANGKTALPLIWRVLDNTATYASINDPKLRTDNTGVGFVGYSWHFIKDLATPSPDGGVTPGFIPGEDYVTVMGEKGLHFGEGPADWGPAADNVTHIYIASNFRNATAQNYQTIRLMMEMFYQ